ncbi:amidohydrolase [Skermania sp. ID1734]|nr:amidohydrolase [Skermania sp. ID1734]
MAVTDGIVVWVGADQPGRALHPDAEVIDLDGAFVAPAFVDTHVHTTATGLAATGLDLADSTSLPDCLDRLRAYAARTADPLIWGQNWDDSRWPDSRPPSVTEIDEVVGNRPVYLSRIDAHSAVCSSALLRQAGAAGNGLLTGEDHHAVRRAALSALTEAQRDRARRHTLDDAAVNGVVALHECAGPEINGRTDLVELLAFDHGVEVRAYWGEAVASAAEASALLSATGAHGLAGDLFVDGAIGARTAWLREPYCDHAGRGNSYLDDATIAAHVRACTEAGMQAGFHAIGDAAIDAVVAGFERVVAELGSPAVAACGHRVEHLEMIAPEHIEKLGSWGIIASVQPGFDALWGGPGGMYARRLGSVRAASMNPFAPLAAAGVSLALSSDAPVAPLRPWATIRAAVNHRTEGFAISPRAAFAAATRGAWRAGGVRDGVAGTLVPGAPASYAVWDADDLVVAAPRDSVQRWSTDPRSRVPPLPRLEADSKDPQCLRTVHRGTVIYAR